MKHPKKDHAPKCLLKPHKLETYSQPGAMRWPETGGEAIKVSIMWLAGEADLLYSFDREIEFFCHAASPMNLPVNLETGTEKCVGKGFSLSPA